MNKSLLYFLIGIVLMLVTCTVITIVKYNEGFRGEQLYLIYPVGFLAYFFLIFVLFIITGGRLLDD